MVSFQRGAEWLRVSIEFEQQDLLKTFRPGQLIAIVRAQRGRPTINFLLCNFHARMYRIRIYAAFIRCSGRILLLPGLKFPPNWAEGGSPRRANTL